MLGAQGRVLVEVRGQIELRADAGRQPARQSHADGHVVLFDGHERDDVGGAEARVGAVVDVEVDEPGGRGDAGEGGLRGRLVGTHEGDHAAVVDGVALAVEHVHSVDRGDGGDDLVDDLGAPALGEVGHALDERHRGPPASRETSRANSGTDSGAETSRSTAPSRTTTRPPTTTSPTRLTPK